MPKLSDRILGIMPSGKDGWEVHFEALARKQAGENILMLSVGDHDFDTPQETVSACITALKDGYHHYIQLAGLPRLRESLAKISTTCTGIETLTDEIIVTQGGQGALFAACQALLDPGDHAVIIAPYYPTYPGIIRVAGADFTEVLARPDNSFEPLIEDIEAAIRPNTKLLLINSPNNPTGTVYSRQTIESIAKICRKHDLWLLSDEVYWTLTGGHEHISPRSLPDMKERTLVINSLSKSHGMTGWRLGWLTAPADVVLKLINLNVVSSYGSPDFLSHAAVAAVDNAYGVAEIASLYQKRRVAFIDELTGTKGLIIRGSEGAMYVMLDISAFEADAETFAWNLLNAENVAAMPGTSFGNAAQGHLRFSMCQPEEELREAARRVRRLTENYSEIIAQPSF